MFRKKTLLAYTLLALGFSACQNKPEESQTPRFTLMEAENTGFQFENKLTYDSEFNIYTYRNFYNGGGVSIGDINNDGLPDIYMTANQLPNRLFLNKGNFQFEDITESSGTAGQRAWSTGVTMVDVNADGLLDIYVCNSGDVKGDNKENELFINQGDLTFVEAAKEYGLADPGYTTHASFFDFDKDGDLDVYILNNSYQAIGSFDLRRNERPKRDVLGGDKLMENRDGKFYDISEKAGIYGSVIGFGLGVTVGDVDGDGWDDIYVSNDFFERDYLYINQQNGTFTEVLTQRMNSISGASMGADMADINNDGSNDLFVTEMLPNDYDRLKSVTTFEDWNRYQYGLNNGYYHQFTRNTFQINTGAGFSELGRLAGVEATDWSWGALIFDMDNDGYKDLYVANGIYQDLTDQDYLQYASSEEIMSSMISKNGVDYKSLIDIIPSNPIQNYAYKNQNGLEFKDVTKAYGLATPSFSNGSAYGDLDNDGDLDLVVNNVNMPSFLYRNNTKEGDGHYLSFSLKGEGANTLAIGTKIWVTAGEDQYYVEQQPTRGFQSSMDPRPFVGLKTGQNLSVKVLWPSGKVTLLNGVSPNQQLQLSEAEATPQPSETDEKGTPAIFSQAPLNLPFAHKENAFVDFDIDRSLFLMKSTQGPKMAVADVNADGFPDVFVGGSKEEEAVLLLGSANGFTVNRQPAFAKDKVSEDLESVFFDADGDGDLDLYVCSGSIEFSQSSSAYIDRLYFNDGRGNFSASNQMLPGKTRYVSSSTVSVLDYDGDGDLDLFVGEGSRPMQNGVPGDGFLLENNGQGVYTDVTSEKAPEFKSLGMITSSQAVDVNGDGATDLIVVGEYMGIEIFLNTNGQFRKSTPANLARLKGWWNVVHAADVNGDGRMDFIVGNHGLNSRFKASEEQPIALFVKDFDSNGTLDPILSKYMANGKAYPYGLRHNLIDQIKSLKKVLPDYKTFKDMSVRDIFTPAQMEGVMEIKATEMTSVLVLNKGQMNFEVTELPTEAQVSPVYAIATGDFDADGDTDILLGGNLYSVKPEVGRYDASYGTFLKNTGNGRFVAAKPQEGFLVEGEVRDIEVFENFVLIARNNAELMKLKFGKN
ncbi:VCBS repeat-containing protein [Roseivirga sp. UBA838]|uniref:VCBS repeat-containing protein n=2 Tax=Roseivirga TaxID=290180 RepID=UPI00257F4E96|nr:VCBS repeat-containing protein [Roseivirga sp. UBA838]|tara:strand:- start:23308 stop:26604 length:3297 start_codon:yes stop_codon:yes gene_type:complete